MDLRAGPSLRQDVIPNSPLCVWGGVLPPHQALGLGGRELGGHPHSWKWRVTSDVHRNPQHHTMSTLASLPSTSLENHSCPLETTAQ